MRLVTRLAAGRPRPRPRLPSSGRPILSRLHFASTFEQSVRAGAVTSVTMDPATGSELELPTIGDASQVYQVKLPLESQGTTSTYYIDYVIFRVHRGLGAVLALSLGTPFDEHLLQTITANMAARRRGGRDGLTAGRSG
jgi:hypothetical protein